MFKRFKLEDNNEFSAEFINYLQRYANSVELDFHNNKYIITGNGHFMCVKMNDSENAYYFKNDQYRLYPFFDEELVNIKIKLEKL